MKTSGCRFEALDAAVECLTHGVGDAVCQVVEQAMQMGFEGLRRPDYKRQATANGTCIPALEKRLGLLRIAVVPKLAKQHAVVPRPRRLQITRHKLLEAQEAVLAHVARIVKPIIASRLEDLIPLRLQTCVLLAPRSVHRLPQQRRDMELVVNNVRLRDPAPESQTWRSESRAVKTNRETP